MEKIFKIYRQPRKSSLSKSLRISVQMGLCNSRAILFLILWYIFSLSTLFLNKFILSYPNFNPYFLCGLQMFITMLCGLVQLQFPLGVYKKSSSQAKTRKFYLNLCILGLLQLGTILFGLIALYYVAVSFAETVKSSAPIFTVFIAWCFLGEKTSLPVFLSLIPVMCGLALCSSHELSFNLLGFICSMATNLCECVQNVVSKFILSDKAYSYNPAELQFYPNLFASIVQFVFWLFLMDFDAVYKSIDRNLLVYLLLNGISFHAQTITAYVLISYISPVTYSVANTTKRAFLIWLSVLLFHNSVTFYSAVGTAIVIVGVLFYSKAKEIDERKRTQFNITETDLTDFS